MAKTLSGNNPALDIINATNTRDNEETQPIQPTKKRLAKENTQKVTLDINFGSTERRTQPITLKVKPSVHKQLKNKSKEFNRSVNDIVNKLLESYLEVE